MGLVDRWLGRSPKALLPASGFPTLAALRQRWETIEQDRSGFLQTLTPASLQQSLSYINFRGQPATYLLWQQMMHVINHSTYHRGQVTTLLRQLGAEPQGSDLVRYFDTLPRS